MTDTAEYADLDSGAEDIAPENASTPVESETVSRRIRLRWPILTTTAVFVAVTVFIAAWCGYQLHLLAQQDSKDQAFLDAARRGALNLTSIDFNSVDADIKNILDSSTGSFFNEFQERAALFSDFVKKAQSTSHSTVTQAGIESENASEARVLVVLSVTSTAAGLPDQKPRAWRMRITVQEVDHHQMKVSNVEFVP